MAQPTPTIIGAVAGYIPRGRSRYVFVPTMATYTAPTLAEVSAGSDLTNVISAIAGFAGTSQTVDFPNAGSLWTSKIGGPITADDSSFTLNRDVTGADAALALFSDGSDGVTTPTTGFFVIMPRGNVVSGKMRVFPIQVTSLADSTDLETAYTTQVNVAITLPPTGRIAIPTA
jgi:hypothetical protein